MTFEEAISYIENYTWSTTRLGLDRTKELLHRIGDPHQSLKFIHVTGSNGKGSTCAMLESILRNAGYKTGLYISPYIQNFCERMQVNGKNISDEQLLSITELVRTQADAMEDHPSQFELVTAIAMEYFKRSNCDIVVLEVGMGGALDSTNVIPSPEAAVITNIGLEHTEYLGSTLEEIATTKGGIIKQGCDCILYDGYPEVTKTIDGICKAKSVPLHLVNFSDLQAVSHSLQGQSFIYAGQEYNLKLLGDHQLHNAATVLTTIAALQMRGWSIPDSAIQAGLSQVIWPARLEVLSSDPLFILDGGHNPQCAQSLKAFLRDYFHGEKQTLLMGVLADKDYEQMLDMVLPYADHVLCVTPNSHRSLSGETLCHLIHARGVSASYYASIPEAVATALQTSKATIAFGSLYMAGMIRDQFTNK